MHEENMSFAEAKTLYKKLAEKISECDKAYYEENNPIISDAEYDQLTQISLSLEEKFPELKHISIFSKVAGKASSKFKKVRHIVPMLSLGNIFETPEIFEFVERIKKYIKISFFAFCLSM